MASFWDFSGKPLVIAEMSGNHNQSLDRALEIVDAAAAAGAHALKLQTYKPETMTLDVDAEDFVISDPKSLWKGERLFELYAKAMTPWEWHEPIFKRCRKRGIIGFSTPFDVTAVDFLESLDVPCHKVASFEMIDIPLLRKIAATGKPVIMSTGMSSLAEINDAVETLKSGGGGEIVLLKCTSSYPSTPENSNIRTIPNMRDTFGCHVGLSDHTLGCGVAVASVALGAVAIEKHFTLSRADGGVDSAFSMEPHEMKMLVEETERAWLSLGKITYEPTESEKKSLIFRRSLYIAEDMKKGDVFTENNLRCIRPGLGLSPKYIDLFLGKAIAVDVKAGTALNWNLLID